MTWSLAFSLSIGLSGQPAESPQTVIEPVREATCPGPSVVLVDAPKGGVAGGPAFNIIASYGPSVPQSHRDVIAFAVGEWEAIIQSAGSTPGNYPISFSFISNPSCSVPNVLACATTSIDGSCNLVHAAIAFNSDFSWFVDPSPEDDSEFDGASPPAGYDLLTVARHEIAHAVGWTTSCRVTNLINGSTFDPQRVNIGITDGGSHTSPIAHPDDVMNPSVPASHRRPILVSRTAAMVARAFDYDIPVRFVDGDYQGQQDGSANRPWRQLADAAATTPAHVPILMVPDTYTESGPITLSSPTELHALPGGTVTITVR